MEDQSQFIQYLAVLMFLVLAVAAAFGMIGALDVAGDPGCITAILEAAKNGGSKSAIQIPLCPLYHGFSDAILHCLGTGHASA